MRSALPVAQSGSEVWEDPRRLPRLVPLFPIGSFTPGSVCPHHGPIRPGSVFCCMICSRSGMDGHPALKRDPRTDPRPEPKVAVPVKARGDRETRKQRRRRIHESPRRPCRLRAVNPRLAHEAGSRLRSYQPEAREGPSPGPPSISPENVSG